LARRVRKQNRTPIIVVSVKGEEAIKVAALDAGADDYVTKPFSTNELLARVRASLRRSVAEESDAPVIDIGDFHIDLSGHNVAVRGREVRLTPKEFEVLAYLAKHPGRVLTHRVLLGAIWGASSVEQPEYLRVVVGHLRKKLEPDDWVPHYIIT